MRPARSASLALVVGSLFVAGCDVILDVENRGPQICSPDVARCDDGDRQRCDPDGASWVDDPCDAGVPLCLDGACLVCEPGDVRCGSGGREQCADNGAGWEADPCPTSAPLCEGDGRCVVCEDGVTLTDPTVGDCAGLRCADGQIVVTVNDEDVAADEPFDCVRPACERGVPSLEPADDPPASTDPCVVLGCEDRRVVETLPVPADAPCELAGGTSFYNACVRTGASELVCWGGNDRGQLGIGSVDGLPHLPVKIAALPPIRGASLGFRHTLAWTRDGRGYGWGVNEFGQALGARGADAHSPVEIPIPGFVTKMAAGANHSCALLDSSRIWCWGRNDYGMLGDGTTDQSFVPRPVVDSAGDPFEGAIDIDAGGFNTCARKADGTLWCWGHTALAGVGGNESLPPSKSPRLVAEETNGVSVGDITSCSTAIDGTISCWGYNFYGEAGLSIDTTFLPTPLEVATISSAIDIDNSYRHTCAIAGVVSCWGGDFLGQLGRGNGCSAGCDGAYSQIPAPVVGISGEPKQVVAHWLHSCAIAGDEVYCWGKNDLGGLGDGTSVASDVAARVDLTQRE